jgi:Leucine-rich repeat (LRR) protein
MPDLPANLSRLECMHNALTHLPPLPTACLFKLWCDDNMLDRLPNLPATITNLGMVNNRITSLQDLPPNLEYFWCSNNRIAHMPRIPASLRKFACDSNLLSLLPELPIGVELSCQGNPWAGHFAEYVTIPETTCGRIYAYHLKRKMIRKHARDLYGLRAVALQLPIADDVLNCVGEYLSNQIGVLSHQIAYLKAWK